MYIFATLWKVNSVFLPRNILILKSSLAESSSNNIVMFTLKHYCKQPLLLNDLTPEISFLKSNVFHETNLKRRYFAFNKSELTDWLTHKRFIIKNQNSAKDTTYKSKAQSQFPVLIFIYIMSSQFRKNMINIFTIIIITALEIVFTNNEIY